MCNSVSNPKQEKGWLDVFQPPVYKSDGSSFLQILPRQNEADGLHYPHIQYMNDQKESFFITGGNYVVTKIVKWDEVNEIVYFEGTSPNEAGSRQFYRFLNHIYILKNS